MFPKQGKDVTKIFAAIWKIGGGGCMGVRRDTRNGGLAYAYLVWYNVGRRSGGSVTTVAGRESGGLEAAVDGV